MTRVFISYRRADSAGTSDEIYAALKRRRGAVDVPSKVFRDAISLLPGEDWRDRLIKEVTSSDWLLAVIGPQWLAPGPEGQPRLYARDDMVRIEIATALQRGVAVLPVVSPGAEMPDIRDLPRDIAMVTRRQMLVWPRDRDRMLAIVKRRIEAPVYAVPDALLGTWVTADATKGSTYEFSADGTFSHMGVLHQRSGSEDYSFEVWEEGVVLATSGEVVLQPFRAQASQSSSSDARDTYADSPRELITRELAWAVSDGPPRTLDLTDEHGGTTSLEFQGRFA